MRGRWERFQQRLCEPVDGSSLGLLRIVFGALVAYEVVDLWRLAPGLYLAPPIRFGYEGFAFVAQSSAAMVHVAFWGAFLSAIAVMLGFCYRVSALALFSAAFFGAEAPAEGPVDDRVLRASSQLVEVLGYSTGNVSASNSSKG